VAAFVQRAINDPGVAPRWHAGIELAAQMDLVHVIGGGFINGLWPRHIGLLAGSWQQPGARAAVPGRRSARCHRSALAVPALPDAPDGRGCWCRGSRCRQLEVLHQQAPFPDRARLWLDPQSGVEECGFARPRRFQRAGALLTAGAEGGPGVLHLRTERERRVSRTSSRPGSRCSFRGLEPRQPSALAEGRGIRRSPGESRPAPEGAGPRRSALRRNAGRAGHGRDGILTG